MSKRRFRNISGETLWTDKNGQLVKVPHEGVLDVDNDYEYSASLWKLETAGSPATKETKDEGSK